MKTARFLISIIVICMIHSGCQGDLNTQSSADTELINDSQINEAGSPPKDDVQDNESYPFTLSLNNYELGSIKDETVNIILLTDIEDWEYTAKAEYGSISNLNENSFDYTRARSESVKNDTITISFTDRSNHKVYTSTFPIRFLYDIYNS